MFHTLKSSVPYFLAGLYLIPDYRGVRLGRFHCINYKQQWDEQVCLLEPASNMNSAEAFLGDALSAHVIAAACSVLDIQDTKDFLEKGVDLPCFQSLDKLATNVVENFTDIASYGDECSSYSDEVRHYTTDIITLSLLWAAYHDARRQSEVY